MKQTDQFIAVPVPQQSAEYNKVQQQFAATAQNAYSTIIKVNITTTLHNNNNNNNNAYYWRYCYTASVVCSSVLWWHMWRSVSWSDWSEISSVEMLLHLPPSLIFC